MQKFYLNLNSALITFFPSLFSSFSLQLKKDFPPFRVISTSGDVSGFYFTFSICTIFCLRTTFFFIFHAIENETWRNYGKFVWEEDRVQLIKRKLWKTANQTLSVSCMTRDWNFYADTKLKLTNFMIKNSFFQRFCENIPICHRIKICEKFDLYLCLRYRSNVSVKISCFKNVVTNLLHHVAEGFYVMLWIRWSCFLQAFMTTLAFSHCWDDLLCDTVLFDIGNIVN